MPRNTVLVSKAGRPRLRFRRLFRRRPFWLLDAYGRYDFHELWNQCFVFRFQLHPYPSTQCPHSLPASSGNLPTRHSANYENYELAEKKKNLSEESPEEPADEFAHGY